MNWRIGGPVATTAAMIAAAWSGIAVEGQDESLAALLFGLACLLLGVLLTMVVVAWWRDGL